MPLQVGDIVRLAHAEAVPPQVRGYHAKIKHVGTDGEYELAIFTWSHYTAQLRVKREHLFPVAAEDAARFQWAHGARETIPELRAMVQDLALAIKDIQNDLEDTFNTSIGILLWVARDDVDAAMYAGHFIEGGNRKKVASTEEAASIKQSWDAFIAAQTKINQAACAYLDVPA